MIYPGEWDVIRRADEAGHFNDLWAENAEMLRVGRFENAREVDAVRARWRRALRERVEALLGHRVPDDWLSKYKTTYGRPPGVGAYGRVREC